MADHIAELLEQRLRIRGRDLETKLRKAGRLLPKLVRQQAAVIVQALKLQGHPKLDRRQDHLASQRAYDTCVKHLTEIDTADRRKGAIIGFLSTNAFNLLVVTALLIAALRWQGFL